MGSRIRWVNVARLCGVLAVLGLVVAWPRLGPGEVALPPEAAVPVATEFSAVPEAESTVSATPRPRPRSAPKRSKPRRVRRTAQVRKAVQAPAGAVSPVADPVAPPIRRVWRPRPLPEFGVE